MVPTDADLLERWRAGDSESGEVLFDRYYDILERFFANKLNDAVRDLVQETFTRCVKNHEKIKDNQFRLYLFGIAYNVLQAHLRERYKGPTPLDMSQASIYDVAPGAFTLVVRRREHRLLLEALRSIPIEDQVILELHYWEHLTTDDIADVLGIPAGTSRRRLQAAREKLGKVMQRLTESSEDLTTTVASLEGWAQDCREHLDSYLSRA